MNPAGLPLAIVVVVALVDSCGALQTISSRNFRHLHSGSNKANVKIEHISDGLAITISDHGRGIPNGVLDRSSMDKGAGVGIVGMKERVKQLGGRLEIETSERGTQVTAVIPSRLRFRRSEGCLCGFPSARGARERGPRSLALS